MPSQGNYIIAINSDIDPNTDVNPGEAPGEPTVSEAQLRTFTHWDQQFVYGCLTTAQCPGGVLFPNGFSYAFRALGTIGGTNQVQFVQITLPANNFTFIPNASNGAGTGNALSITLPISQLSLRSNPGGASPSPIMTPAATQIFVNYITTDTSNLPQDQLGCGINSIVPLGPVSLLQPSDLLSQLTTCPGKTSPTNPNLFITGGEIIVNPAPPT